MTEERVNEILKDVPYSDLDEYCLDTGKTQVNNICINIDGALVWIDCIHKILLANGAEVLSDGYVARVTKFEGGSE